MDQLAAIETCRAAMQEVLHPRGENTLAVPSKATGVQLKILAPMMSGGTIAVQKRVPGEE
jgi:hypothetical protein